MRDILKIAGGILLAVLLLDFFAFAAWIASNQTPADGYYFGAITANLIKAILAAF